MSNGDFEIELSDEKQLGTYQRLLDRMGRDFRGKPVSEIKSALRAEWKKLGGDLTDSQLDELAKRINKGTPVVIDLKMRH